MDGLKNCPACKKPMPNMYSFCGYCGAALDGVKKKRRKISKRPNGDGCIRYLKGRSKPYAAYLPRENGKAGKYIGSYETSAEASKALAVILATRPSTNRADWTVGDFYNYYVESAEFSRLSRSAQSIIRVSWKYCAQIADIPMRDAKTQAWQNCVDIAVGQGKSVSTCKKIRELASTLCKEAMKDDVINKNYSSFVRVTEGAAKKEKDIFTDAEIKLLIEHDADQRVMFILMLIYTGMRISELLDVSCENIHDGFIIGGNKTAAGKNRIIPILPQISPYIAFFNRGNGLLIHNSGKPVLVNFAREKWFYAPLVELGILSADEIPPKGTPRLTPHCTRHTFATLARQAGIEQDVLTRVIGHSDYSTTDEIYIQMQAEFLSNQMQKMAVETKFSEG